MNQETAGKILFSHFQREHYHKPLVDFSCGDADAYDIWVNERWIETPLEVRDRYQAAAQNLILSAQQSMHKDFAGAVFYLNAEGKPEKIMSLEQMDECAKFLSQQFDHNPRNVYGIGEIPFLARHVIEELKRQFAISKKAFEPFLDDLIACLRAFSLVATSVGENVTPEDKDARLRGLISMIEVAITAIRNNRDCLLSGYRYLGADFFQSNYPDRGYLEEILRLRSEVRRLKGEEIDEESEANSPE